MDAIKGPPLNLALQGDNKMVKALSLFDNINQLTPYAVGFDRVFDNLTRYVEHNSTSTGFPPYNMVCSKLILSVLFQRRRNLD